MKFLKIVACIVFCSGAFSSKASFITNSDLVGGGPTINLPSGWTFTGGQYLFDGVTENSGYLASNFNGVRNGGADVTASTPLEFGGTFLNPFDLFSFGFADDFGVVASSEITSLVVTFFADSDTTFTYSGLNDDSFDVVTLDKFLLKNVEGFLIQVTGIESSTKVELREFLLEGEPSSAVASVSEPSALALLGLVLLGTARVKRLKSKHASQS